MACVGNDDDLRSICTGPDVRVRGHVERCCVCRSHHRVGPGYARNERSRRRPWFGLCRCAGIRRAGGRREKRGAVHQCAGAMPTNMPAPNPSWPPMPACAAAWATSGAGQVAKMMNQICIAGLVQGLSEALHFGESGMDGRAGDRGSSLRVRPDHGKWPTATAPCWTANSTMASRWIGCARIWPSAFGPPQTRVGASAARDRAGSTSSYKGRASHGRRSLGPRPA